MINITTEALTLVLLMSLETKSRISLETVATVFLTTAVYSINCIEAKQSKHYLAGPEE